MPPPMTDKPTPPLSGEEAMREALKEIARMGMNKCLTDNPDYGDGYDTAALAASDIARSVLFPYDALSAPPQDGDRSAPPLRGGLCSPTGGVQEEAPTRRAAVEAQLQAVRICVDRAGGAIAGAAVASCECDAKTPDPAYHEDGCRYKKLEAAANGLQSASFALSKALATIASPAAEQSRGEREKALEEAAALCSDMASNRKRVGDTNGAYTATFLEARIRVLSGQGGKT